MRISAPETILTLSSSALAPPVTSSTTIAQNPANATASVITIQRRRTRSAR